MGLVRLPELAAVAADLERRGWARLPRLADAELAALRAVVDGLLPTLGAHELATDLGFVELWAEADEGRRRARQAELAGHLQAFLDRCFTGYRPVMFNVWLKSEAAERSLVPMHRDFALVDERRGPAALQLWIPLVDVGPGNGGLLFEDGSHRTASPTRQYRPWRSLSPTDLVDLRPGHTRPPLAAGEGVVFSNRTLHGSSPNRSAAPRPAVGCVLLPAEARIIHWVHRPPDTDELWGLDEAGLAQLRPGRLPAGAERLEVVAGPRPPPPLPLAGGGWLRARRVPGVSGVALLTGADGRFVLRQGAALEALEAHAGEAGNPEVARLAGMGLVHRPGAGPDAAPVEWHHEIHLSDPAGGALDPEAARALAAALVAGAEGHLDVRLAGDEPLARPDVVRALVDALTAEGRRAGLRPGVRLATAGPPVDADTAAWLVDAGVVVTVRLGVPGPSGIGAPARAALDHLAAAAARRGLDRRAAYLHGLLEVDGRVAERPPSAVVNACLDAGVRYLELAPADDTEAFLGFYAGAVHRILEVNLAGTLLVEKRLALFLESLLATGAARRLGRTLSYDPDGTVRAEGGAKVGRLGHDAPGVLRRRALEAVPAPAGCAACVYDPYCGSPLARTGPEARDPGARAPGTPWCLAAMGTLDTAFDLLGGAEQQALRRVFQGWMAARAAVGARRRDPPRR